MFYLHVLILKAEKQLFPHCKPVCVISIQVIVVSNLIYIGLCYIYLCSSASAPPPAPAMYTMPLFWFANLRRGRISCGNNPKYIEPVNPALKLANFFVS